MTKEEYLNLIGMDEKVKRISYMLGISQKDVALTLYCYLSTILEELVTLNESSTMFGKLKLDEEGNITFLNNKFEFDNELFSKKDLLSILKVVEHGPGAKIFGI